MQQRNCFSHADCCARLGVAQLPHHNMRLCPSQHKTVSEPGFCPSSPATTAYELNDRRLEINRACCSDHLPPVSREPRLKVTHSTSTLHHTGVTDRRECKTAHAATAMVKLAGALAHDESDWNAVAAKGNKAAVSRSDPARDPSGSILNAGSRSLTLACINPEALKVILHKDSHMSSSG